MKAIDLTGVGKIAIKPLINPNREDLGLKRHNCVVFPGTVQIEPLACVTINGKDRYITGLDEFAPEVKSIRDKEMREATIKSIRETVSRLELEQNYNQIDVEDKDFWQKVTMFRPDNKEIWSKIEVVLNNNMQTLNPQHNMDHLILVKAIEANGFSMIAPSLEDAINLGKSWYLERQLDVVTANVSLTKLKNKALGLLDELYQTPHKLLFVAKDLDGDGVQYTYKTLPDLLYDSLDKYIQGLSYDNDKKRCANSFIQACEMSIEDLKIKAMIKDLTFHRHIILKPNGMLHEESTGVQLGRTVAEALLALKNPTNEDMLLRMIEKSDKLWN